MAVFLRGETVEFAASFGLDLGEKGTKVHLCQQQELGMGLQQQPGCVVLGCFQGLAPRTAMSYTANGFILSSAMSL